ncbi:hypothetical protein D3C81_1376760 [compost metagenome]
MASWQVAKVRGEACAVHQEAQVDHQRGDHHGHREGAVLHQLHHHHLRRAGVEQQRHAEGIGWRQAHANGRNPGDQAERHDAGGQWQNAVCALPERLARTGVRHDNSLTIVGRGDGLCQGNARERWPQRQISEILGLNRCVPLGMAIVAWKLPGAKANQRVAAVEEALVQLA